MSVAPTDSSPFSLADRITKPEASSNGMNADAQSFVPGKSSWADEVASPVDTNPPASIGTVGTEEKKPEEVKDGKMPQSIPQTDGAGEPLGGSSLHEPDYNVDVKLSDMQMDPNNPLFSVKTFEELGLDPTILKGIYQMNFRKPSKIQERALPLLLINPPMNMIGQSQSGTGKTAAFVLNILSRLDLANHSPQGLVLAPSRELARQILGVVQTMGGFMEGLETSLAVPADAADRAAKLNGHIIVGTPGTVMDKIKRRQFDPRNMKVLVLDEADNMLDQQGMGDQCIRVKSMLPPNIQVVLFSATFPDKVVNYASRFAPNANQITLRHEELTVEGIKQLYLDCQGEEAKYDVLVKLYGLMTIGSSIIFVKRRDTAVEIERRMTDEGHHVASLTGAFEGAARDAIIDKFRLGHAKVLITTNVLARGIDVQSVSMVINYDIPEDAQHQPDPQTYLHRIGRTGRFGRVGVSVSFVHDAKSWRALMAIQQYFNCEMIRIETKDWDDVEEMISKIIKSSRAGENFKMME